MNAPLPNKFAIKAASSVRGKLAIPVFGPERSPDQTDFNDLAQSQGLKAVSRAIAEANFVISESSNSGGKSVADYQAKVSLIRGTDLRPKPVDWLWRGWLAAGKFHLLAGAPGTGKTTISMALAATVTVGGNWPDGTKAERGNVIIWTGEDDPSDTLVPRLIAGGGDTSAVYFVGEVSQAGNRRPFDPARDIDMLIAQISEVGNVRLIVLDPVVSAIAGDSHKNAEVRRGLQPLVDLATAKNCAVLGITHFSKGTAGRNPIERVMGSNAFGAVARVLMVAAKHQDSADETKSSRIFCRAKSNIGPDDGGFSYELRQTELESHSGLYATHIQWVDTLDGEARDLLAAADAIESDGEGGKLSDAKRFLKSLLEDGPMPATEVQSNARGAGYSIATIRRAKDALKVEAMRIGKGRWEWRLPISSPPPITQVKVLNKTEDAHQKSVSTYNNFEHLQIPIAGYSIEI